MPVGFRAPTDLLCRLLGREAPVVYGPAAGRLLRGRRVLVTGGAGSIGSEILRQVHSLDAGPVFMLDHDESGMHAAQVELSGDGLFDDDRAILCDIRDSRSVNRAMEIARPDIVFHAAAHKHLPLLERYPAEGVRTNVFGTLNVVNAAAEIGVTRFVNISTDKAANPSSVLGATKRLAEMLVLASARQNFQTASVRFGNVLGSRGSFLPSLIAQVASGRPVTITDPQVTRYFMTIPEASGLVIEAAVMAQAGETYVLDMGAPIKIVDLVERYIELTGLPHPGVQFTGLRPGEKLHEQLFTTGEAPVSTGHRRISVARAASGEAHALLSTTWQLHAALEHGSGADVRSALYAALPVTHDPSATGSWPELKAV